MMVRWRRIWVQSWGTEAFSCGVRAFLALSSLMAGAWWLDQTQALIPLLLGVIVGALAETDESWRGQIRGQFTILLSFVLMAMAVQASQTHAGLLWAVLALAAFGLTLLGALGARYQALGLATLIMAMLVAQAQSGRLAVLQRPEPWLLAGAAWYGLISVLWAFALPMMAVRQNLTRLYDVLGVYLQLKSRLLTPVRDADLARHRLTLALHNGRVVEALNLVKESLFLRMGRARAPRYLPEALHLYFVAQDVHERVSSSHELYQVLTDAFFHSDVLYRCQSVLAGMGQDCRTLLRAKELREPWPADTHTMRAMEDLQAAIRHLQGLADEDAHVLPPLRSLQALADNLADTGRVLRSALDETHPGRLPADSSLLNRHPQTLRDAWQRVRRQLHLSSPLMRHAVRLTVALTAGYAVMRLTGDRYGYWILMTIIFVCRPQYGATFTRLFERIWGTLLGLVVGWALLRLFPDVLVQSAFAVTTGAVFFATRQSNYMLATAAITSLVLLSFNQVGDGFELIAPRMVDTLVGSLISGLAVWLVLPSWQSRQLPRAAARSLHAQALYLREITDQYREGRQDNLAYRLARRNAHNADAELSGALSAMFKEPMYVRRHGWTAEAYLVLSHTLLNYLSALGARRDGSLALAEGSAAARAVDCVTGSLDALALALHVGGTLPAATTPVEATLLNALERSAQDEGQEHRRVQLSLLCLALRLLPSLREQAARLVAASAGDAPGPGSAANTPLTWSPPA